MIFVIGMWIWLLAIFFHSGEDTILDYIIELLGCVGVFLMCVSVSILLLEKLP